ncbi:hypothetical protein [Cellulomonas alba]|uniref:Ribosomally synthesized peptide with SipW-like signal peptide n=1 Tax=Cellulomonas alba TaxID=3053467 RepID=A0ABT7SIM3_9CELL|nr:hypothetical protein [Cellulomonas alba]MDM7855419.1 hypothetical protein [Cellulomonas alba]
MTSTKPTVPGDLGAQEQERKRKKRGAVVKFTLAGVALLGVGAAATSAQWSDDAWFSASASAATLQLQGSLDSTPLSWDPADTKSAALAIPAATFSDLAPNESRTYTVHVKNAGSTSITVTAPVWSADSTNNAVFSGSKPATVSFDQATSFTLAKNATKDVIVTVKAGNWTNADTTSYQGATGAGWVTFSTTLGS